MIAPSESPKCAYESGREFDDALLDQLDVLPEFVVACSFRATVRVHLNSSALWLRLLTTNDDDWLE
jgi:hypothetical protein